ncbi:LysR family transcriptional regulator [Advenella sp. FME57]|uniref:LysR family transcriptional regulator n=1 Tax=Advenella sp. FME57 TaxID=2742604 RepID=UPI00186780F4|nr:LysR family transcriptional regulator [Advenella sp. FME57]
MDTNYLETFVKTLDCASISDAARYLDITPGAVSARIRGLEQELGQPLIRRSGHTVRPTEHGLLICDKARQMIQDSRDMTAMVKSGNVLGELRLGSFFSGLTTHLPRLLEKTYEHHPDVSIFVSYAPSVELCQQVHSGTLDIALAIEPQFAIYKNCSWLKIQDEPLTLIVPPKYATTKSTAHAHDLLRASPFIRYARSSYSGQLVDRYLKDHRIVPNQRLEIDSLLTIASLVARGVGVALVPDSFSLESLGKSIQKVPLSGRTQIRKIGMIWSNQSPRGTISKSIAMYARNLFN